MFSSALRNRPHVLTHKENGQWLYSHVVEFKAIIMFCNRSNSAFHLNLFITRVGNNGKANEIEYSSIILLFWPIKFCLFAVTVFQSQLYYEIIHLKLQDYKFYKYVWKKMGRFCNVFLSLKL